MVANLRKMLATLALGHPTPTRRALKTRREGVDFFDQGLSFFAIK